MQVLASLRNMVEVIPLVFPIAMHDGGVLLGHHLTVLYQHIAYT